MADYNIPTDKEIAEKVRQIILADLSVYDSVTDLAAQCGINPLRLKKTFKQLYGIGLTQFSRQERIRFAQQLLTKTNNTIQTIAEQCGYTEGNNFQTSFKEVVGCTPGEWRKRHQ